MLPAATPRLPGQIRVDNLGRLIRWLEAHDPYTIVVLHCPGMAAPRVGGRGLAVAWDQHLGALDPSALAELLAAGASAVHIAACPACQKADTPSHLGARFASGYVLPYTPPRRRPLRHGTQLSLTAIPLPRHALFAPIHGPIHGRDADPFRAFAAWHRLATAGVVPLPAVARWDGTMPLADADVDALHAIRCAACSDGLAHCPNGATDARTIRATYSTLCRACRTAIHYCTRPRRRRTDGGPEYRAVREVRRAPSERGGTTVPVLRLPGSTSATGGRARGGAGAVSTRGEGEAHGHRLGHTRRKATPYSKTYRNPLCSLRKVSEQLNFLYSHPRPGGLHFTHELQDLPGGAPARRF